MNDPIVIDDSDSSDGDIIDVTNHAFTPEEVRNRIFFTNLGTKSDEATKDDPTHGNCALVAFFQYVKLTRMDFEPFDKYLSENITKKQKETYETFKNRMKNIWSDIYSGKINSWQITYNGYKYDEPIKTAVGDLKSDYSMICYFEDIILYAITGLIKDSYDDNDVPQIQAKFDKYIEFMSQYTKTIPFFTSSENLPVKTYDQIQDIATLKIKRTTHIFVCVYDVDHDKMLCFNNNYPIDRVCVNNRLYYPFVYCVYKLSTDAGTKLYPFDPKYPGNLTIDLEDYNLSYVADDSQVGPELLNTTMGHALSFFYWSMGGISANDIFKIFLELRNDTITDKDVEKLKDGLISINQYDYDKWPKLMCSYKTIKEDGVYKETCKKLWHSGFAVLNYIFKLTTGLGIKYYYKNIDALDNKLVQKYYKDYINKMSKYYANIPLVYIYFNNIKHNLIHYNYSTVYFGFGFYRRSDKKFIEMQFYDGGNMKAIAINAKEKYCPIQYIYPYSNIPAYSPLKIKAHLIKPLIDNQSTNQLKYTYSSHFEN